MSKIAIRVDANEIVATGHIMRCRTIAMSLQQMGCSVVFVSADNNIIPYIQGEFECAILDSDWRNPEQEIIVLLDFLHEEGISAMLVDSYYATPEYIRMLETNDIRTMYIDDMQKERFPATAILNYSPGAPDLAYEEFYEGEAPTLLLGTKYIPIRDQFVQRNRMSRGTGISSDIGRLGTDGEALVNIDIVAGENQESADGAHRTFGYDIGGIDNIFLTTGGADSMGLSEMIISAIMRYPELHFKDGKKKIHLLAGRFYRVTEKVQQYIEDGYVALHQNVSNVADIMNSCDVAITPAGTTLYELCAVGVPSISFVFAENQEPDALYFAREGYVPYAGDFREDVNEVLMAIVAYIEEVMSMDTTERIDISNKLKKLIDGQGADRIAEALMEM
ncbi:MULTISPECIES: PseG/SpsG family protein [unclassified Butyrivibrio]|uniref:PseG/SpsG family protein n=1 Tax=unclassified Butyrivibrio TaxID=2639466 RepID=UPI000415ADA8|nr:MULTISPECIES: glycosyltransferase [unclassified Butyrivibrio]